jgi:hypothetical protein
LDHLNSLHDHLRQCSEQLLKLLSSATSYRTSSHLVLTERDQSDRRNAYREVRRELSEIAGDIHQRKEELLASTATTRDISYRRSTPAIIGALNSSLVTMAPLIESDIGSDEQIAQIQQWSNALLRAKNIGAC